MSDIGENPLFTTHVKGKLKINQVKAFVCAHFPNRTSKRLLLKKLDTLANVAFDAILNISVRNRPTRKHALNLVVFIYLLNYTGKCKVMENIVKHR